MSEPAQDLQMTTAEFLKWDDGTETRYELAGGQLLAMAPPREPHGRIAGNVWGEIDRRLESRPPCAAIVEGGIWISDADYYVADVTATCAPPSDDGYVAEPFLIVEVLSNSDRGKPALDKVLDYIKLSSVQEIWLIDSRKRWFQQWRRGGPEQWIVTLPLTGAATFESPMLRDTIALDRLYRNTGL